MPVWLLFVAAASYTGLDNAALRPRNLKCRIGDDVRYDQMLLQEAKKQNEIPTLAIGLKCLWRATTHHIMLVGSASLCRLLRRLFLSTSVVPKNALMRCIVGIDGLH